MPKRTRLPRLVPHGMVKGRLAKDIKATQLAYYDSWNDPPAGSKMGDPAYEKWWKEVSAKRNLEWKGTDLHKPEDWFQLAKIAGQYNEFDPEKVYYMLHDLPVRVSLGREGSVAIYVEGSDATLKKVAKRFRGYADEIDRVTVPYPLLKKEKIGDRFITVPLLPVPSKGEKSRYLRIWFD